MEHSDLPTAAAIARAVDEINQSRTVEELLDAIVHATRSSLPAFEHVSVSERRSDGTIETRSGTGQLVWDLDGLQYDLGEGPCVDAIEHEPVVVVEHLRHDQRWPRYIPAAAQRGVLAQVGVQLFARGRHVGGLNLYSTEHEEVDQESVETARLLAGHVSIVLGHVREEHHLNQAIQTRKVIGQAIGILMERYRIDEDRAFQFMLRASQSGNIKLRDIAQELVTTTAEQHRSTS